ncbi:acyl carrier protein [Sphingobium chlorophenolicum]|uniref:Phosphopantetheine-binding protein n=1 Tax=Sphingobium chlorophenolicum TaxID=46429 RepID=A0A081R9U7_SPHCR|nr:acyl carrier protein [Sphingobium chlorophenolicum]KEQ51970.1 Phosphopantetheine-binding protein [Sphingobium chlorophenolicum]
MNSDSIRQASAKEIEDWIVARIAEIVNMAPANVSADAPFDSFGIDSAKAISLMVELENWLNLPDELPLELLFEAEAIRDAAAGIAAAVADMAAAQAEG